MQLQLNQWIDLFNSLWKKLAWSLAFVVVALCAFVAYSISEEPLEFIIISAIDEGVSWIPRDAFLNYLVNFREPVWDQTDEGSLSVVQFVLNGCYEQIQDPNCRIVVTWALGSGDLNSNSGPLGLTPLHGAVLSCNPEAVRWLLGLGADPKATVSKGKFQGQTPREFLGQLKCPRAQEILNLLQ